MCWIEWCQAQTYPQEVPPGERPPTRSEHSLLDSTMMMRIMTALFTLTSTAFQNNTVIPSIYTRVDGDDISPPLYWEGIPPLTKSLVLIVDDPDAPDPQHPKMTWVHWVLYNIPPTISSLSEGSSKHLPAIDSNILEARNDWKRTGYGGPAPPIGTHRYHFKLYALDTILSNLGSHATKQSVVQAMQNHVLAETQLIGLYQKQQQNNND